VPPDIGHGPDWQEKQGLPGFDGFSSRKLTLLRLKTLGFTAQTRQKSPPAAGLGLGRRADLFRKFIAGTVVVDSGIVGRPNNWNHRGNGGWNGFRNVLARPEQRRGRH